jgi:hypothetical protein
MSPQNPMRGLNIKVTSPGKYPFADADDMIWSTDSSKYIRYNADPAIVITARGMTIPSWGMKDNSADVPPLSPVRPEGDPVLIDLVPYGAARLRITEFPLMDVTLMEDVMRPGN